MAVAMMPMVLAMSAMARNVSAKTCLRGVAGGRGESAYRQDSMASTLFPSRQRTTVLRSETNILNNESWVRLSLLQKHKLLVALATCRAAQA